MDSNGESGEERATTVRECYLGWLWLREASEEEDANVERERRVAYMRMVNHQQTALAMCLDLVVSMTTNGTIPCMARHESRSCWKMERRQNKLRRAFRNENGRGHIQEADAHDTKQLRKVAWSSRGYVAAIPFFTVGLSITTEGANLNHLETCSWINITSNEPVVCYWHFVSAQMLCTQAQCNLQFARALHPNAHN